MSIVFIAVLVTSNIYLTGKIAWIFSLKSKTWLHIMFALIPLYMIGGMIGFSNSTSALGTILYAGAAVITGILLYMLLSFLFTDLMQLFYKFKPMIFGLVAFPITLVISGYGLWNATKTKLVRQEVSIRGLNEPVNIAHFSDNHLGHFRGMDHLQKLVDLVSGSGQDIDMVAITGDLYDGRRQLREETLEPLKDFQVPVFFVEGNHDKYSGVTEIKQMLREAGFRVLEDETEHVRNLQVIGLNHMRADGNTHSIPPNPTNRSIRSVLEGLEINADMPSILLHHSPDGIKHANAHGIDLYLAGHTHGGQLFPMNYLNDVLFKYNRGLGNYNGTWIYVSQGSGTFGPPMRVCTRSEVTLIRLKPAE